MLSPPPPPLVPVSALDALMQAANGASPGESLTQLKASGLFYDYMTNGHAMPLFSDKRDKSKAEKCVSFFAAVATKEEKEVLLPPKPPAVAAESGERKRVVDRIHGAALARLREAYGDAAPRELSKRDHQLPASGIATHLAKLKAGGIILDTSEVGAWRVAWEAKQKESPSPPSKKSKKA